MASAVSQKAMDHRRHGVVTSYTYPVVSVSHSNMGSNPSWIGACPCCVGKAGARCPPPPSERHAAAEAAFAKVVANQVVKLALLSPMCDAIRELDGQVQRGLVRRQAAAWIASSMRPVDGDYRFFFYPSNLLRCVLHATNHKTDDCKCLDTVLVWGCCPTQVFLRPPEERWESVVTALQGALHQRERRPQWESLLLTYGCIPCEQYRPVENKVTGHVTLVPEHDGSSPWLKSRMLEWARWHPRCRKRQWVAAMVS